MTSVLDLMSGEVRHLGGRVVFCTQSISDVYENVRNQLYTQFVSKSTHKKDLNQIHSNSARFVKRLWCYAFINVQALNFLDRFYIDRLNELPECLESSNYIASETLRNEESVKPTVKRQEEGRETPYKGRETREKERETQKEASASSSGKESEGSENAISVDKEGLENDLMRLLNERTYYVSELEDKYDKDGTGFK